MQSVSLKKKKEEKVRTCLTKLISKTFIVQLAVGLKSQRERERKKDRKRGGQTECAGAIDGRAGGCYPIHLSIIADAQSYRTCCHYSNNINNRNS